MNYLILSLTLIGIGDLCADLSTIFLPKPQGYYTMHYRRPHQDDRERCAQPATVAVTTSYQASWRTDEIARALFGAPRWHFTGSEVVDRAKTDILADNFGLAPDFNGTVHFGPEIKNITLDLSYLLTLSSWCEYLYIELAAPLVHSRWKLTLCEADQNRGMPYFPQCDMGPTGTVQPAQSIIEALSGDFVTGELQVPWYHGKWWSGTQEITRLADISAALGSTIYQCEGEAQGMRARAACVVLMPTGNRYDPTYIFQPIVGNGSRWELGGTAELRGWWEFDEQQRLELYWVGTGTHIFSKIQQRVFDFTDYGPFSRYLMLKQYRVEVNGGQFVYPYAGILSNAINFATRCCEVSCPFQGDMTLQATYCWELGGHGLQYDLGYNLYGRTAEHLVLLRASLPSEIEGYAFAPKGTAGTCYRLYEGDPLVTDELLPSPSLNGAQAATIYGPGPTMAPQPVELSSSATIAMTWNSNNNNSKVIGEPVATLSADPTYQAPQTSNPPRFLTTCDLNPQSAAAPKSVVHTLFSQLGYRWDCGVHESAVLLGGAAIFGRYGSCDALCEWSMWAQFNVRF